MKPWWKISYRTASTAKKSFTDISAAKAGNVFWKKIFWRVRAATRRKRSLLHWESSSGFRRFGDSILFWRLPCRFFSDWIKCWLSLHHRLLSRRWFLLLFTFPWRWVRRSLATEQVLKTLPLISILLSKTWFSTSLGVFCLQRFQRCFSERFPIFFWIILALKKSADFQTYNCLKTNNSTEKPLEFSAKIHYIRTLEI